MPTDPLQWQIACHESAHAVCAHGFGFKIGTVSIIPDDDGKGHAELIQRDGEPLVVAIENIIVSLVADLVVSELAGDHPEDLGMVRHVPSATEIVEAFDNMPVALAPGTSVGYVARSDLTRAEE